MSRLQQNVPGRTAPPYWHRCSEAAAPHPAGARDPAARTAEASSCCPAALSPSSTAASEARARASGNSIAKWQARHRSDPVR